MKTEIATREKYTLAVDLDKNRLYFTPIGFWQNPEDFPNFFQDWEKAIAQMKKGFTGLGDMTKFKTPGPKIKPMLEKVQKMTNDAGLRKTAEVFGEDAAISEQSLDNIAKRSGMKKLSFKEIFVREYCIVQGILWRCFKKREYECEKLDIRMITLYSGQ